MPNWCANVVKLSHDDSSQITRIIDSASTGIFNEIIPCPKELSDTVAGRKADLEEQAALEAQEQNNQQKYGYKNWYEFKTAKWGTKWDVCKDDVSLVVDGENDITLSFDTAWSPPIGIFEELLAQGYQVTAYYYEPGMVFAGIWEDGEDNVYNGWKDAESELPSDLEQMFNIAEMENYDEE